MRGYSSGAGFAELRLDGVASWRVALLLCSKWDALLALMVKDTRVATETVKLGFQDSGTADSNESQIESMANDVASVSLRRDDFDRNVWCLAGIPADISDIGQAVGAIDEAVREGRRLSFVTPNVNWLTRAASDKNVRQELINADLSLIDGAPLAALARGLDVPIRARVAGSDLFEALRRRPAYGGRRLKVFFFGGRDGAAEAAAKTVNAEKGGVEAVGWLNPGFGDVEAMSRPEVLNKINDAAPDFVLVALGAGKGQRWIEHNQLALTAPVLAHLGAVVDFTGGGIRRAPTIARALGMEWAWRIKEEPALWRRYARDAIAMAAICWSRVIPQMRLPSRPQADEKVRAELVSAQNTVAVRLSGAFHQSNLRPLRGVFREAAAETGDVILDFTNVSAFDRAFLGLVLMLEKHVAMRGAKLYVEGVNAQQMKLLKANDMRYPDYAAAMGNLATADKQASAPSEMRARK